jgi:tetratricopeptide (TPR) repeat protein
MASVEVPSTPLWRRGLAYWWYVWGLSLCYSANRAADRGLYAAGVRSFGRAARLWPALARAHYRSGLIRGRELGEYRAALDDLAAATALEPEWPEPYLQRGLFQRFHGDSDGALADLERYLELGGDEYWRSEAQRQVEQIYAERQHVSGPSGE